jgi:hypothetical protein
VYIRHPVAARMLRDRIFHVSARRDIDIGCWVRTFHEESNRSSPVTMELLMRAVNLVEFWTKIAVSAELLVTLRQSCPSLRSLKVWVESYEAMAQVGLFQHIKQLAIVTCPSPLSMDPLTGVPYWNMPAVTHFWWQDSWMRELPHGASFVSRCRFPHLTHLEIEHCHRRADLEGAPYICRLLDAHRNIKYLRLWVRNEELLHIIPSVRAPSLQIGCLDRCPPFSFVPLLRLEVKNLGLEFRSPSWERYEHQLTAGLWELLTQLASEDGTPPTLDTICLSWSQPNWEPNPKAEEKFLNLCALRSDVPILNARGICVFVRDKQICV